MKQLKLIEFIKDHNNWEELLQQEPYCLKIKRDNNYIIFNYNQIMSDFSNSIVKEARGIILEDKTYRVVCFPFMKFFNVQEPNASQIDWESARVQEKIDGSLMKVWFHNGTWHLSTNGQIDAADSDSSCSAFPTFKALFLEALKKYGFTWESFTNTLDTNYTYMFELTSPYNRVVIEYFEFSLHFLVTNITF